MNSRWSGYNNIGVCATAIMSVLKHSGSLTLAKALIIMPLVMHDATVRYMGDARVARRGAAALAGYRPDLFANFSERFEGSLGVTLNAIQLLVIAGFARFDDSLTLVNPLAIGVEYGKRMQKIVKASEHIAFVLGGSVDEIYLNFRVSL